MIYDEPEIRHTGDLALTVEFGDDISLQVSFRVIAMAQLLERDPVEGIVETIPTHRSIGIVLDANRLGVAEVEGILRDAATTAMSVDHLESRIVRIPMLYDDPWSRDCAADHGHPNSFEVLCEANGLTAEQFISRHTGTDHWVGALGFTPGCTQAFPLQESHVITGPKAPVPRTWTYPRIVALGGRLTAPYTVRSPGGYQMLGRTPLDWYDPTEKNPTYGDDIILCRVGDRQRYESINLQTYEQIREDVMAGTYEYQIEDGSFSLADIESGVER